MNSEGTETFFYVAFKGNMFESSVNSEGTETILLISARLLCLRVV